MSEGSSRRARGGTLALAVATLALTGACGDGGERQALDAAERHAVERALGSLRSAYVAGDRGHLCALMDITARRQAAAAGGDRQPGRCARDLAEAFAAIGAMHGTRAVRLVSVRGAGDMAIATVAIDGHGQVGVPFVRRDGSRWLLGSFFGTRPLVARTTVARELSAEPDAESAVRVKDEFGEPCPALLGDGYPQIAGGCELIVMTTLARMAVVTAFGRFELGECQLGYRVLVDSQGRTWTDSLHMRGRDRVNNGCFDIGSCASLAGDPLPWSGRISRTRDGGYVHRFGACFDTCVGSYAGPLAIRLARGPHGWRAYATDAAVGASGLRLSGRLIVTPARFALGPAAGGQERSRRLPGATASGPAILKPDSPASVCMTRQPPR